MRDEDFRQLEMFQHDNRSGALIPCGIHVVVPSESACVETPEGEEKTEKNNQSPTKGDTKGNQVRTSVTYEDACLYIG